MTWRIGVSTACSLEQPILSALGEIRRAGIAGIEVSTPPGHFDPGEVKEVAQLKGRIEADGLTAVSIHAPFGGLLDLADPNPHHRYAAVGAILTAAGAIQALGGGIVVVHPSDRPRGDQDIRASLENCASAIRLLQVALEAMDLTLAVESPLPHLIGGNADDFAHLLSLAGPEVRVCLDTSHTTLGHQWPRFVERVGDRLIHVHANDHRGHHDDHLPPGDGIIHWEGIGDSLRRLNYTGWLILELNCPSGSTADTLNRARRALEDRLGPPAGV